MSKEEIFFKKCPRTLDLKRLPGMQWEVQVASWDKSQTSCLCRTVALNIQLISDTGKSTLMLSAEPCSYFFLVFSANNNLHKLRNPTYLITVIWYSLTFWFSLVTVVLTGKQAEFKCSQLPGYQEILCCHLPSFHHCTRQAIKVNLGSTTSVNALWQPCPWLLCLGASECFYWGITAPEHLKPSPRFEVWAK